MAYERHQRHLEHFAGKRILVLGDVMLDRFIYGRIERVSPEAPVPVLLASHEEAMPGGAANVARNIAALGGQALLIGVVGDDDAGRSVAKIFDDCPGISTQLLTCPDRPTTVKIRYIAERQQVVRVDYEVKSDIGNHADPLLTLYERTLPAIDLVVLSDYAKGVLSDMVVREAIRMARAAGKTIIVDPKSLDMARYNGATFITPNLGEAALATGVAGADDAAVLAMADAIMSTAPDLSGVIVTRSADGMTLVERGAKPHHLRVHTRTVYDVSGAGDTVIATLALALSAGADPVEAVQLANISAGIVVGKLGTATVSVEEVSAALQGDALHELTDKNALPRQAALKVANWKAQGLRVGFTNGCFDLIHPGHVSLLMQARKTCDRLVVGLNSDASVKRLKGESRPMQGEDARSIVLDAMSVVDLVVIFNEDTPLDLIRLLKPDVLVKGADYSLVKVVGADFVQSYGGRVVLADLSPGQSTTGIISRMALAGFPNGTRSPE